MKERIPRKLKKGLHSLLKRRDTKWKRKAINFTSNTLVGYAFAIDELSKPLDFPSGGIVSDKPIDRSGEYVMGKDEQERLRAILQQPIPETHHVTINLDKMPMADKLKLLRK